MRWYGEQAKQKIHTNTRKRVLQLGYKVEAKAKENIQRVVYDMPPSLNYLRTGLAMSSIQTVERDDGVYVGSDAKKFKEQADVLGVKTGGVLFYLPYIEKGHELRNGEFYPARPFLVPALDAIKHEMGAI
jgi:hypothetical protein